MKPGADRMTGRAAAGANGLADDGSAARGFAAGGFDAGGFDAREFEAHEDEVGEHGSDEYTTGEYEAAVWSSRRRDGLDPPAAAAFERWLAADPRHATWLAGFDADLDALRQLPAAAIYGLRTGLKSGLKTGPSAGRSAGPGIGTNAIGPTPAGAGLGANPGADRGGHFPGPRAAAPSGARWRWRPALAGPVMAGLVVAVAIAIVAGAGWSGWQAWRQQPVFVADYQTGRGQRLPVELPDGSRLLLDAASRVEVRLYRDRREVRQRRGQAMYAVQSSPGRPFEVRAGEIGVRVIGTRFSVRYDPQEDRPGQVAVAVEAGRVDVVEAGNEELSIVRLGAGQAVSSSADGQLAPPRPVALEAVAAWRQGRIEFNDTPLAEAIAELERYGDTGLVVRDPAVAALRLGGSVDLSRLGSFVQALPHLLPIRLEPRDKGFEIVRRP